MAEDNNILDFYPEGGRVIAALSGGSDSMAMLTALLMLRERYSFTLEAAHVNHCLRGEQADSDERFVRDFCEKQGIKLHIQRKAPPRCCCSRRRR